MKRFLIAAIALTAACGGSDGGGITPLQKKPDPYVTVRVRNMLDTTTATGRAHWHVYAILTGPYDAQNGVSFQGAISLQDVRLGLSQLCAKVSADSVGQRLITILALGDTTTSALTADTTATRMAQSWFAGDHNLSAGWAALTFPPNDAWDSQQYQAGHGLTRSDPIRWGLDWTGAGTVSFYERTDTDPVCSTF